MMKPSKLSRLASGAVVGLNLVALVSPVRADALDMPGGYNLEFLWHQFHWFKRSPSFEIIFVVGGFMLVFGIFVHAVKVVSRAGMFGLITTAFAAQLLARVLVDIARVSQYHPPFHQDLWRAFAFFGGLACLTSLCIQATIVVESFRKKADNNAFDAKLDRAHQG